MDITRITYPDQVSGIATLPPDGRSLLPVFLGQIREEPEYFMSGHTERFRMFREGDWKIVRANQEDWELYNMNDDRTEINNLADKQPEKVQELVSNYEKRKSEWPK
jgi:arylsulfatase